jgi:8-oxo-dGTP pyrophosphatase MutT (NUDIX family)
VNDVWRRLEALPGVEYPATARAAVLVPLYEDGDGAVRVVLTKRPDDMRTHPGDVVFPGGMMESGEDPIATAKREAWEEVAIPEGSIVEVLGGLSPITTRNRSNLIIPVVARIDRPDILVPDPSEVDLIIEPTVDEMLDENRWRTNDWMGHQLWFYEFPEGILWGATGFMMREFLEYLR